MGDVPRVATIVLNWNRRADTLACVGSLSRSRVAGATHRVMVVDNGSTDGSVAALRQGFPGVDVLALAANQGFAAGMNAGIARALGEGADWVHVLNNDTLLAPTALARLLAAAATAPDIGVAVPTVYYLDRPAQVWPSAGRRRRLTLAGVDTTAHPPGRGPYDVDWATGCCLLIRRQVLAEVGLFDPRYAFYYEDHDLCLRVRAAGWRLVHVPTARVWHRVSASTGPDGRLQNYLLARASVRYYATHTAGAQRALMLPYRMGSFLRIACRHARRGRTDVAAAYARGLADGWRDLRGQPTRSLEWALWNYNETS